MITTRTPTYGPDGLADGGYLETTMDHENCSVSISMNAKGQLTYDAKIYFESDALGEVAALRMKELTDALDTQYAGRLAGPTAAKE